MAVLRISARVDGAEGRIVLGRQDAGATEADFSYMGMGSLAWRVTYQQGY